ncbi:hypothetical protein GJ599_23845 [Escherichia coli]|nr:hypothetical protein [Escherichia coli]
MIWQPEFTDKILSRKPGAVQRLKLSRILFFLLISKLVLMFYADYLKPMVGLKEIMPCALARQASSCQMV